MVRKQKAADSNKIFSDYYSAIATEAAGHGVSSGMTDRQRLLTASWGGEPRIKLKFKEGQTVYDVRGRKRRFVAAYNNLAVLADQYGIEQRSDLDTLFGYEYTGKLPRVPQWLARTKTAKLLRMLAAMTSVHMLSRASHKVASLRLQRITHQLWDAGTTFADGESGIYMRNVRFRQRCTEVRGRRLTIARASGLEPTEIDAGLFVPYSTSSAFDISHTGESMTW